MDDWILDVIAAAGYAGIALLMLLENAVPMIPSELILPFAGYLAARGELDLVGVIAIASVGSTAGATGWYYVGRAWGRRGVYDFVERRGRWLLLDLDDVKRADAAFERHQGRATFLGRLMPGVRSLISVPAGIAGMPLPRFLGYTTAGTVIWTTVLTVAGYVLADAYERARDVVGPIGSVVFIALFAGLVVRHLRKRRRARIAPGPR